MHVNVGNTACPIPISAVDGTITITFSKKPLTTPVVADFAVAKSVDKAAAVTVTPTAVAVTSDTAVKLTVPAVDVTGADQSVVYTVTYGKDVKTADAYTVAKVADLTATASAGCLTEVNVVFNQKVDETTAEKTTNYIVSGTNYSSNPVSAVLQADGKTVLLTVAQLQNQGSYKVAVAGVKSAVSGLAPSLNVALVPFDGVIPVALKAEITGPKTLKVTFSEPVTLASIQSAGAFNIDNNTYSILTPVINSSDTHAVDVTLSAALPAGAHTVTVSNVLDYASYKAATAVLSFTYAVDTTVPTVALTSASQTTVKITFSKAMDTTTYGNLSVYHTYNGNGAYKGVITASDSTSATFSFYGAQNYLPLGTATVYVSGVDGNGNTVKDVWGNALAATSTFTATITTDNAAPTVTSVEKTSEANGFTVVSVGFSEDVTGVVPGAFTLKDSAGNTKTIDHITLNATTGLYDLYITPVLGNAGDTYTLAVAASTIKDLSASANYVAAVTKTFVIADTKAPEVKSVTFNSTKSKIFVIFDGKMTTNGVGSVLDLNNYRFTNAKETLDYVSAGNQTAMPAGTTIALGADGASVIITLPANYNGDPIPGTSNPVQYYPNLGVSANYISVVVGQVKDLAGNVITGLVTAPLTLAVADLIGTDIDGTAVKAVTTNTITFPVDKTLSGIDVTKFSITQLPGKLPNAVVSASYVNSASAATVTVTFRDAWETWNTPVINMAPGALTTSLGITNSLPISMNTIDAMPPVLKNAYRSDDGTTLLLIYSEPINPASISVYTYNVSGNTITDARVFIDKDENNNDVATNFVFLTLGTALTSGTQATFTQALAVQDWPAQNTLAASTTAVTTTNTPAQVVADQGVRASYATTTDGVAPTKGVYTLTVTKGVSPAISETDTMTVANGVTALGTKEVNSLTIGHAAAADGALTIKVNDGATVNETLSVAITNGQTIPQVVNAIFAAIQANTNITNVYTVTTDAVNGKVIFTKKAADTNTTWASSFTDVALASSVTGVFAQDTAGVKPLANGNTVTVTLKDGTIDNHAIVPLTVADTTAASVATKVAEAVKTLVGGRYDVTTNGAKIVLTSLVGTIAANDILTLADTDTTGVGDVLATDKAAAVPAGTGNVTLTLDTVPTTISIPGTALTPEDVAAAIRAKAIDGYTLSGTGANVVITKNVVGPMAATFGAGSFGVAGTIVETVKGTNGTKQVNTITVTAGASQTGTYTKTLTIGENTYSISTPVVANDTVEAVAGKIYAQLLLKVPQADYTVSVNGAVITITKKVEAAVEEFSFK